MKKLVTICLAVFMSAVVGAFFLSCAGFQVGIEGGDQQLIMKKMAKTAGFALGVCSVENPELRSKVEELYYLYKQGTASPEEAVNAGLYYLLKDKNIVYVMLGYQLVDLLGDMGVTFDEAFNIVNFGFVNTELLTIGKDAYLQAIAINSV